MSKENILMIAEAIRKDGVPQGFGKYKKFEEQDDTFVKVVSACAIGMASINLDLETGTIEDDLDYNSVYQDDNRINNARCPEWDNTYSSLSGTVIHLNDIHKWTFEQIADFLVDYANNNFELAT